MWVTDVLYGPRRVCIDFIMCKNGSVCVCVCGWFYFSIGALSVHQWSFILSIMQVDWVWFLGATLGNVFAKSEFNTCRSSGGRGRYRGQDWSFAQNWNVRGIKNLRKTWANKCVPHIFEMRFCWQVMPRCAWKWVFEMTVCSGQSFGVLQRKVLTFMSAQVMSSTHKKERQLLIYGRHHMRGNLVLLTSLLQNDLLTPVTPSDSGLILDT